MPYGLSASILNCDSGIARQALWPLNSDASRVVPLRSHPPRKIRFIWISCQPSESTDRLILVTALAPIVGQHYNRFGPGFPFVRRLKCWFAMLLLHFAPRLLTVSNEMDSSSPYKSVSMRQNGNCEATIRKMRRSPT